MLAYHAERAKRSKRGSSYARGHELPIMLWSDIGRTGSIEPVAAARHARQTRTGADPGILKGSLMRHTRLTLAALAFVTAAGTGCQQQLLLSDVIENIGDSVLGDRKTPHVRIITSQGTILVEVDEAAAPATSANFLNRVDAQFYDGTIFHRVIPGFIIQGGGFLPDLTEKPAGSAIPFESTGLSNLRGTIAMARTDDPNSARSQFFINLVDNPGLDPQGDFPGYAVFGRVVDGMDVVDRIASVATQTEGGMDDVPVDDVIILQSIVERREDVLTTAGKIYFDRLGEGFRQFFISVATSVGFVAVERAVGG